MFMIVNRQGNFNPGGGFQGFEAGPDIAWILASFSLPELSSSLYMYFVH